MVLLGQEGQHQAAGAQQGQGAHLEGANSVGAFGLHSGDTKSNIFPVKHVYGYLAKIFSIELSPRFHFRPNRSRVTMKTRQVSVSTRVAR